MERTDRTPTARLTGSAGVALPGEPQALDWGLALGVSLSNFAATKINASTEGFVRARQFTRDHLQRWSLERITDDVLSVVGELTANAVCHTGACREGAWLALATSPRSVMCIVRDPSTRSPTPRHAELLDPGGRGLGLVSLLSAVWGWHADNNGKAVWARVPI
ncbi:ATP-binding protein [Streptomyces sp. NPDC058733]|uniref:ATP-binding protein n=1 Tax=unclassified Streptomyces TaxID=2593676 RepID=UPI003456E711